MVTNSKPKRERDPLDRYYTPEWVIDQCLDIVVPEVTWRRPENILEPSAGDGSFVRLLRQRYPSSWITAIDIDPEAGPWSEANDEYEGDFLETDWSQVFTGPTPHLIIGNPPYGIAREFCETSLEICDTVIFILRVDFLCSAERAKFFQEYRPSHVFLLPNRVPFYGPALLPPYTEKPKEHSTGEYDYAWICWSPMAEDEPTKLIWLPEVPLKVRRAK